MINTIIGLTAVLTTAIAQSPPTNTTYLTAPALVTSADNSTIFQCWRLMTPFKQSGTPGVKGATSAIVANFTTYAYTIIPPRFDGGLHNAPVPQLVHFLSGVAHLTLPQDESAELWIMGGKGGLLFAVDTLGSGHVTRYPSDQDTVAITAPFADGEVPEYEVVADGACLGEQTF